MFFAEVVLAVALGGFLALAAFDAFGYAVRSDQSGELTRGCLLAVAGAVGLIVVFGAIALLHRR